MDRLLRQRASLEADILYLETSIYQSDTSKEDENTASLKRILLNLRQEHRQILNDIERALALVDQKQKSESCTLDGMLSSPQLDSLVARVERAVHCDGENLNELSFATKEYMQKYGLT